MTIETIPDPAHSDDCPCRECIIPRLLARIDALSDENSRLKDPGFDEMVAHLTVWTNEHYPAHIFDGSSGDPGPVFVVAVRAALAALAPQEP